MPTSDGHEWVERRTATAIGSTQGIPAGMLVSVPVAPVSGHPGDHPVVAVNTQDWYTSVVFWGSLVGFPVLDAVSEYILAGGQFDRNRLFHIATSAALGAYLAWRRKTVNTVLK